MNKELLKEIRITLRCLSIVVLVFACAFLMLSFTTQKLADDFLKQLGITKPNADTKIVNSIIEGSLDQYGLRNAKNIALGNRAAVAKDLLQYVKDQVNTESFKKAYAETKQKNKPSPLLTKTPEDFQKDQVESSKKSLAEVEANHKKADATLKPMFEKILVQAQKQLKDAGTSQEELDNVPTGYKGIVVNSNYSSLIRGSSSFVMPGPDDRSPVDDLQDWYDSIKHKLDSDEQEQFEAIMDDLRS